MIRQQLNGFAPSVPAFDFSKNQSAGNDCRVDLTPKYELNKVTAAEKINRNTERGLRLGELERSGFHVRASYDQNRVIDKITITNVKGRNDAKTVYNIIASCNSDINLTYRDTLDLEASKLARKSKKPLWVIAYKDGGVILERQF